MSVTSGMRDIDARNFFMTQDGAIIPTKIDFDLPFVYANECRVKHLATSITSIPKHERGLDLECALLQPQ